MIHTTTIFCALITFFISAICPINSLAVMSVDLGTEFMKIAIVKPGIPMDIVLNKESRRKTPVIIALKGQDREFGEAAISRSIQIPGQSYMFLRELVGKSLDNPIIQQYIKRFPYYKMKTDTETNQLVFEHDSKTSYTVEELLAMILKKAREYASDFAEQTVDSAVITVPPYFTQSERRAVQRACELANIKLLQLMNDNTAAALNYGIFRRKDFNTSGSTYLFYDMGAQSTTCTIVTYNVVKTKENGYLEEIPQLTVKAVAFDRDLGGVEFQIRLRDYLAAKFAEKHPKINIMQNGRALGKLFREAERAKHVLSANVEYTAQVEGLIDDIDFKHHLTREIFEKLCEDLFQRATRTIDEVLQNSGIGLSEIQQVLLFGGATRIPRVQSELIKSLGSVELSKSLNTDEAAALGAVYQAAALSKGYRVKKFLVKDSNQYPINVIFERQTDQAEQKLMDKTLFHRNLLYPNRKVITFNRYIDDFSFDVHYGNLTHLTSVDKRALGETNLFRVRATGVHKAFEKHKDSAESRGVKAHFLLDDSCLITLDRMEFAFEKVENQSSQSNEEKSTFSKIGSKISSFFSSKGSSASDDDSPNTTVPNDEEIAQKSTESNNSNKTLDLKEGTNSTDNSTTVTNPPGSKIVTIREPIQFQIDLRDYPDPSAETRAKSIKKLADLDAHDREIATLAKAKNSLETLIYDIRDKLEHDAKYKSASTSEEQNTILNKAQEIATWLEDDGYNADAKTLNSKLEELRSLTKPLKTRVNELNRRPEKLQALKEALNVTEHFLRTTRQIFSKKDEDEKPFTEGEMKYLDKLIKDTYSWRDQALADFAKLAPTDNPKYLSTDFDEKINALKRETNYLLTKAQRFVPKSKTSSTTAKVPLNKETKADDGKSSSSSTTGAPETESTASSTTEDNRPEL